MSRAAIAFAVPFTLTASLLLADCSGPSKAPSSGGGSTAHAGSGASGTSGTGASGSASTASGTSGTGGGGTGGGSTGLPTPTPICGTSMLKGPTSAPAGAVTVMPGASTIQNAI